MIRFKICIEFMLHRYYSKVKFEKFIISTNSCMKIVRGLTSSLFDFHEMLITQHPMYTLENATDQIISTTFHIQNLMILFVATFNYLY